MLRAGRAAGALSGCLVVLCALAASGTEVAKWGLVRHPLDGPKGNTFGFDDGGPDDSSRRIAHVSVAVGKSTRVRFVARPGEDARGIRIDAAASFAATRDPRACSKEVCTIRIEGRLHDSGPAARNPLGETLRIRDRSTGHVLDSMQVHVYAERILEARVVRMGAADTSRPLDASRVRTRADASLRYLVASAHLDSVVKVELPPPVARLGFVPILRNGIGRSKFLMAMANACAEAGGVLCLQDVPYRWAWLLQGPPSPGFTPIDSTERDFFRLYPRIGRMGRAVGERDGCSVPVQLRFDRKARLAVHREDTACLEGPDQRWMVVFDSGDNPAALHHNFLDPGSGHRAFIGVATPSLPGDLSTSVGDVLAHELGHALGLGDVDDPTNRMHYNIRWADHLPVPFAFRPLAGVRTGTSEPDTSRGPWCQWEDRK